MFASGNKLKYFITTHSKSKIIRISRKYAKGISGLRKIFAVTCCLFKPMKL